MVTNTQPHAAARPGSTTGRTELALTAMTFSFLFGPSSLTASFLLDANLPTVANWGSCEVAGAGGLTNAGCFAKWKAEDVVKWGVATSLVKGRQV
jgi:hypothetical protein